jgi:hypothetical protein
MFSGEFDKSLRQLSKKKRVVGCAYFLSHLFLSSRFCALRMYVRSSEPPMTILGQKQVKLKQPERVRSGDIETVAELKMNEDALDRVFNRLVGAKILALRNVDRGRVLAKFRRRFRILIVREAVASEAEPALVPAAKQARTLLAQRTLAHGGVGVGWEERQKEWRVNSALPGWVCGGWQNGSRRNADNRYLRRVWPWPLPSGSRRASAHSWLRMRGEARLCRSSVVGFGGICGLRQRRRCSAVMTGEKRPPE